MSKYNEFIFEKFDFDTKTGQLSLRYSLDSQVFFEEKVFFDVKGVEWEKIDQNVFSQALFNLHLIAGVSYYKTYCPKKLIIKSGQLDEKQIDFWNKLYTLGLGEFFYNNQIDFRELVNFSRESRVESQELNNKKSFLRGLGGESCNKTLRFKSETLNQRTRCLVPIGGGKDSVVTAELLKKAGIDFTLFSLGDYQAQKETAEIIGKSRIIIQRQLSENLFELKKQGAYNGHVPISAYIAFLTVVAAVLHNYNYIILSNEHSANYGNLDYLGININHQYSKSLEFEKDLNKYVDEYITKNVKYFSLLRPFYELKIAEMFSHYPQYFDKFTSCNKNFRILKNHLSPPDKGSRVFGIGGLKPQGSQGKTTKWCCKCPKCVFVFTILAPFISKKKMIEIFGKNLFEEKLLQSLFLELMGKQANKPFECVGTAEEVNVVFYMISQNEDYKNDLMVKSFVDEVLPQIQNIEKLKEKIFKVYFEDSLIPASFRCFFFNNCFL